MSAPETFVARWLRLKRQADAEPREEDAKAARQPQAEAAPPAADEAGAAGTPAPAKGPAPPAFDPESLPSIESIAAGTDIRAFLQSGVPRELTKAALRRAWSADPAIRDFMCLAENQWDFTDPTAIGGFGPLQSADDVGQLVAQAMGELDETAERVADSADVGDQSPLSGVQRSTAGGADAVEAGMPDENATQMPPAIEAGDEQSRVDVASRDEEMDDKRSSPARRRGHGSALPQ